MAAIGARRCELAQLVADHRLRYEHRHVLAAVVHRDRMPDELGEDRGGARPGLQHALLLAVVHFLDPLHQLGVDERPLLTRPAHRPPFPLLRERTMSLFDAFFLLRVRKPSVGLPHGVTGCEPLFLPSPPPCGWSTGVMTVPRTVGRLPFHRERPALPPDSISCVTLPSWPIVARQAAWMRRISPDGSRSSAMPPSLATSCAEPPAERTILPPCPGRSSMLCTVVPVGIDASGRALPGRMSTLVPDSTVCPTRRRVGAR